MEKMIIEARVNEVASREANPNIPWTPVEIAADARECRDAGASIIHFHTRKSDGATDNEYENYLDVISNLRQNSDILIHPTLGGTVQGIDPEERLSRVARLVGEGYAPDFIPLDMLSTNLDFIDPKTNKFQSEDTVYANSVRTLRLFVKSSYEFGVVPYLQIWNVPCLRLANFFIQDATFTKPIFLSLSHSDKTMIWSHPATLEGLEAFLPFVPKGPGVFWSVHMYGASLLPFVGLIAKSGGHIALGLGDYPYRELGLPTNADLIARVVQIAKDCGREIASPDETRLMLNVPSKNRKMS